MSIYSSQIWPGDDGDCDRPLHPANIHGLSMAGEKAARDAARRREDEAREYADQQMHGKETCWAKWAREDKEKHDAKQAEWRKIVEARS